jgi:hypothetical protein
MNMRKRDGSHPGQASTDSVLVLLIIALLALAFPTGADAAAMQSRSFVVKGLQGPPVADRSGFPVASYCAA